MPALYDVELLPTVERCGKRHKSICDFCGKRPETVRVRLRIKTTYERYFRRKILCTGCVKPYMNELLVEPILKGVKHAGNVQQVQRECRGKRKAALPFAGRGMSAKHGMSGTGTEEKADVEGDDA